MQPTAGPRAAEKLYSCDIFCALLLLGVTVEHAGGKCIFTLTFKIHKAQFHLVFALRITYCGLESLTTLEPVSKTVQHLTGVKKNDHF